MMALASNGRMGIVWGFSGFGGVVRNLSLPFGGTPKFFALALLVCEFEDSAAHLFARIFFCISFARLVNTIQYNQGIIFFSYQALAHWLMK